MAAQTLGGERIESHAAPGRGPLVVAGLGSVGKRHFDNLRGLGQTCLALYRTGRGTLKGGDPDGVPIDRDLSAVLARRPRAVIVSNPTALHIPFALAAARAGAHLFIEKPLSDSLEGVEDLRHEVKARGLKALVGFQFRFHPSLRQIKTWLDEEALGRIVSVHARWGECLRSWHPWEDYRGSYSALRKLGGGVVLTLCHPFDYLRWLVGEVVTVSAETAQLGGLEIEVEDSAQVILRFASGAIGSVNLDYVDRPPVHSLRILGRKGRITWDNADGVACLEGRDGRAVAHFRPPAGFERNTLFREEMRHFLRCLDDIDVPVCTVDDGIQALRIALAVIEAARSGRRVHV
jgi:predicted dehydrogenase